MKVTDLDYNQTLSITNGKEKITWMKKADARSLFKFRRMHFKGNKLYRVSDNRKLGTADDEELMIRLDSGWKRL